MHLVRSTVRVAHAAHQKLQEHNIHPQGLAVRAEQIIHSDAARSTQMELKRIVERVAQSLVSHTRFDASVRVIADISNLHEINICTHLLGYSLHNKALQAIKEGLPVNILRPLLDKLMQVASREVQTQVRRRLFDASHNQLAKALGKYLDSDVGEEDGAVEGLISGVVQRMLAGVGRARFCKPMNSDSLIEKELVISVQYGEGGILRCFGEAIVTQLLQGHSTSFHIPKGILTPPSVLEAMPRTLRTEFLCALPSCRPLVHISPTTIGLRLPDAGPLFENCFIPKLKELIHSKLGLDIEAIHFRLPEHHEEDTDMLHTSMDISLNGKVHGVTEITLALSVRMVSLAKMELKSFALSSPTMDPFSSGILSECFRPQVVKLVTEGYSAIVTRCMEFLRKKFIGLCEVEEVHCVLKDLLQDDLFRMTFGKGDMGSVSVNIERDWDSVTWIACVTALNAIGDDKVVRLPQAVKSPPIQMRACEVSISGDVEIHRTAVLLKVSPDHVEVLRLLVWQLMETEVARQAGVQGAQITSLLFHESVVEIDLAIDFLYDV